MNGDVKLRSLKVDELSGRKLDAICARERRTLGGQLALLIEVKFKRLKLELVATND